MGIIDIFVMSLFVGNLPRDVNYDELKMVFDKQGPCKIVLKGAFAFVDFEHMSDAEKAKEELVEMDMGGVKINIEWSKKSKNFDPAKRPPFMRRDNREDKRCYNCDRSGHLQRDCKSRPRDNRDRDGRGRRERSRSRDRYSRDRDNRRDVRRRSRSPRRGSSRDDSRSDQRNSRRFDRRDDRYERDGGRRGSDNRRETRGYDDRDQRRGQQDSRRKDYSRERDERAHFKSRSRSPNPSRDIRFSANGRD